MSFAKTISAERDLFYRTACHLGRFPMWATSRPSVIDAHHAAREGGYILASNHFSHYDVPILMRSTPRRLDFVSTTEAFAKPWVAWLFSNMNAFPLDRHHADPKAVRVILDRLARGRVIAMFPESGLRREEKSVVNGGAFQPGLARIARMAKVPIVPVVVYGSTAYTNLINMLPLRRVRHAAIFGQPIDSTDEQGAIEQLKNAWQTLFKKVRERMVAQTPKQPVTSSASSLPST